MVVTKYSLIGAVLKFHPETEEDFKEMGMHCISCPSSARETIEQACAVHGIDADKLL